MFDLKNRIISTKTYVSGTQKNRLDGSFEHPRQMLKLIVDRKIFTLLRKNVLFIRNAYGTESNLQEV